MAHSIKINRALKLSTIGAHAGSAEAMLESVPDSVIKALPSRQLAQMIDALWQHSSATKAIAARAIIAEGGVWDSRANAFRPLA